MTFETKLFFIICTHFYCILIERIVFYSPVITYLFQWISLKVYIKMALIFKAKAIPPRTVLTKWTLPQLDYVDEAESCRGISQLRAVNASRVKKWWNHLPACAALSFSNQFGGKKIEPCRHRHGHINSYLIFFWKF